MSAFVTRLAPSPTGALHLGNARTFLITWLLARRAGGRVLLRIEDLDRARSRPEHVDRCLADLEWLGLDHDGTPLLQSSRLPAYEAAFARLAGEGFIYPCICTRKEIQGAASAPHGDDEGPRYPGTCRERFADAAQAAKAAGRPPAWRFRVAAGVVSFDDAFLGRVALDPSVRGGDFVVRSFDGTFAYQLAVVVDDAATGVNEVVRADDLVTSTPRQLLLYRALGEPPPRFTHLPLVVDGDGLRLAKRRGDVDLAMLREAGVDPGRVVARLARWSGMSEVPDRVHPRDLLELFDLARVPRAPLRLPDPPLEP